MRFCKFKICPRGANSSHTYPPHVAQPCERCCAPSKSILLPDAYYNIFSFYFKTYGEPWDSPVFYLRYSCLFQNFSSHPVFVGFFLLFLWAHSPFVSSTLLNTCFQHVWRRSESPCFRPFLREMSAIWLRLKLHFGDRHERSFRLRNRGHRFFLGGACLWTCTFFRFVWSAFVMLSQLVFLSHIGRAFSKTLRFQTTTLA